MLFAKLKHPDGKTETHMYTSWDAFHAATFSPETDVLSCIPFRLSGRTYAERRESARNLAIDVQAADDGTTDIGLSYGELHLIQCFFESVGRRYGLLTEFRENCIC